MWLVTQGLSVGIVDTALLPNIGLTNALKMVYDLNSSKIPMLVYKNAPHKIRRDVSILRRAFSPTSIKLNSDLLHKTKAT